MFNDLNEFKIQAQFEREIENELNVQTIKNPCKVDFRLTTNILFFIPQLNELHDKMKDTKE